MKAKLLKKFRDKYDYYFVVEKRVRYLGLMDVNRYIDVDIVVLLNKQTSNTLRVDKDKLIDFIIEKQPYFSRLALSEINEVRKGYMEKGKTRREFYKQKNKKHER